MLEQKLLLVIDVQRGFINTHTKSIVPVIERIASNYSQIIATRFFNPPQSNFRKLLNWQAMDRSTNEFLLALSLPNPLILDKCQYSALTPNLLNYLRELSIIEVHLCGIDTDACVLKTALDMFDKGFRPIVLGYACASSGGLELHESALKILSRSIGCEQIKMKEPYHG